MPLLQVQKVTSIADSAFQVKLVPGASVHMQNTGTLYQQYHGMHAVQAERAVVEAIGQCQKPDMAQLQGLVEPVGAEIAAADRLTLGRRSAAFNYAKATAEALPALSWVVYSGPNCGAAPLATCRMK